MSCHTENFPKLTVRTHGFVAWEDKIVCYLNL